MRSNTEWRDSIQKEMNDVIRIALKLKEDGEGIPPGYQYIECHMLFYIKMEDFRKKSQYVAGGHMTSPPVAVTYASVVTRESVQIVLPLLP
jgi:hypothetical protein